MDRHLVALDELVVEIGNRPRDTYLRLLASDACERLGALPEAADHLSTILMTEPQHLEANRRLARLLCEIGDTSGAVRCWRRVLATTAEEETDTSSLLAIALCTNGEHDAAIELLTKLTRRHPSDAGALANLGMALLAARRAEEALAMFSRALELEPEAARAFCGVGLVHYEQERWQEAAAAFRVTERLAPWSAVGPFNLGLALERLGEHGEARRALLRAAALEPHDEEIQAALEPLLVRPSIVPSAESTRVSAAAFRGELSSFDLLDVLEFLRVQEKTGCLVVSAPPGIALLRLEQGMLIGGSAPRLKRLGEVLVRRGLITREQLERLHAREHQVAAISRERLEPDATSLAALLLRERLIDEARLSQVLFRMTLHIISQIKQWREGIFAFHPSPGTSFPIRFNVQRIVLELSRIEDEMQQRTETT
jgi:tetratricopeptide (TPR) repeat protein